VSPNFGAFSGTQTIAGGTKLAAMAALFQYYRFTKLRWRLLPSNTNAIEISGYAPDATTAVPNYSGVVGLPLTSDAISINASSVVIPSVPEKIAVPRKMLLDQNLRWWRTQPIASEDVNFINQGSLWVGSSVAFTNQILVMDLEYTCEFKDFIAPADLPLITVSTARAAQNSGDDDAKSSDFTTVTYPDEVYAGVYGPHAGDRGRPPVERLSRPPSLVRPAIRSGKSE
jgi:hypothetical protein